MTYSDDTEGPYYQAIESATPEYDESVTMQIGGQGVELSSRFLIDLDSAVAAAITFLETNSRPEALDWEPC